MIKKVPGQNCCEKNYFLISYLDKTNYKKMKQVFKNHATKKTNKLKIKEQATNFKLLLEIVY